MNSETIKIMQNHRSIRRYLDKQIEEEILKELFTSAQSAPSSHNVQAYSIIVVKDKEKKEKLSEICGSQAWIREAPVFLVFCADLYRLKIACEMHNENYALDGIENLIVGVADTALAAQNVMIGAESLGLGGVMIGGIRNNPQEVVDLLALPKYVIPIMGMCLGYPDPDKIPWKKPRLPQYAVVHREEYNRDSIVKGLQEYEEITSNYYKRRTDGERDKGWTKLMSEYINTERRLDLKDFIIDQGIKLI